MRTPTAAYPVLPSLALALAYAAAGILSLQIAVPPGYAAPLFPSSGIALAGLLMGGTRLWPAVFVGSLLVQMVASGYALSLDKLPLLLLIPAGATLQALTGCWLTRRLIGWPNALDEPRSVGRFLGLVAPLGCLVAAAVAVPLLHAQGIIGSDDLWFNAWSWWLGDTMGVMIFAPLLLAFFGQPRETWHGRRLVLALPLLVALVALVLCFMQVNDWERERIQTRFERDAAHLINQVQRRLDTKIELLNSLSRLVTTNEQFSRTEWHDFVSPWLAGHPGLRNLAWNPLVARTERESFVAETRARDWPDFQILDRDIQGNTFPAAQADIYLPIRYVEPVNAGNRRLVGLNPLSLADSARAIEESRGRWSPIVSPGIRLSQDVNGPRGVVIYLAVPKRISNSQASRGVRGVISSALGITELVEDAMASQPLLAIDFCLVDVNGRADARRLYGQTGCENLQGAHKSTPRHETEIMFAGRHWRLVTAATPRYLADRRSWTAWTTLVIGVAMVALLTAFLLTSSGHTGRVEARVRRRTEELAQATARLQAQQDALAEAQRVARMGSWEQGAEAAPLDCSEELRNIMGLPMIGAVDWSCLTQNMPPLDRVSLLENLRVLRAAPGHSAFDCSVKTSTGVQMLHFTIESEGQPGAVTRLRGTVQNVTAQREAEAHIKYLARYDALTGLPNRVHWLERVHTTLQAGTRLKDRCAVLFLDLDRFKTVNDSLGHIVGDKLLAEAASRFSATLRDYDVLARQGGDEFVVLLPRLTRADDPGTVARKLIAAIAKPFNIEGHELAVTVSIGIAVFPEDGNDVDTLLKHADVAMYGAKQAGRNNFQFFIPEMNARALDRLHLEADLRRAIERNELILHYQPQVDLHDGQVRSCEALVRWQHPQRGMVPPGEFIPLAEESGLILPLGDWVLNEGCRQQAAWAAEGMDLRVGINISALQFRQADFASRVEEALKQSGAKAAQIELEITESALMSPDDTMMERLRRIEQLGVVLALDDFGTGYSCLAYLKRLPINRLKIDRSFVCDLPHDPDDVAITSATLSLAGNLGLEVVAEGVETHDQRQYLTEAGCHSVQGFLISRPLPAEALVTWLKQTQPVA